MGVDLTKKEKQALTECEGVIEAGLHKFLEVGTALLKIRDGRLYRATHTTFDDYCRERWCITRGHAYSIMQAVEIAENVQSQDLPMPANTDQMLALRNVPPEEQAEVYREAIESAPGGNVTAAHIRSIANRKLGRQPSPSQQFSTIVALSEPLYIRAVAEAEVQGVPLCEIVQRALTQYFGGE
jgi:hypothetical protein